MYNMNVGVKRLLHHRPGGVLLLLVNISVCVCLSLPLLLFKHACMCILFVCVVDVVHCRTTCTMPLLIFVLLCRHQVLL